MSPFWLALRVSLFALAGGLLGVALASLYERWSEKRVVDMLADAWNAFCELPEEHPCDAREFCSAIHVAQSLVLMRPARRDLSTPPEVTE